MAATRQVGFPVGHASAQMGWRGLLSRPTWRILLYSADDPPEKRGLVLVDGVRMGSATLGQFDFSTIGLAGIERIEVLRGPGASVYGADAVGGVLAIPAADTLKRADAHGRV